MSQYAVEGERKIKYIYCQKCPLINKKRVRYRLENVIDGQVYLRCPGCGHRRIRNTYEYTVTRLIPRQDEWQQTPETLERLQGKRCLDCDAIISEPAIVGRPAWCVQCGGHATIGNRKGLRLEPDNKRNHCKGSKIDRILNGSCGGHK